MAAYTTIDDPSAYFQTAIYTGNGGTISIVNDGNSDLQPDWLWFKVRSHAGNHSLQDSVRGASLALQSDTTSADADVGTSQITAFNSDGFSLASGGDVNTNSRTYVAWQWKAGTSFSNDASSTSVGSVDSTGSVSTDAGFSIINVVKANTTAHTVAHGLGAVPQMIIGKSRTGSSYRWIVYHKDIGNTHALYLNENFVKTDSVTFWNDTTPTSSVFSLGTDNSWNGTSIFYCFAEKKGYSKFGTFVSNNTADNVFIYTGFAPSMVILKSTTSTNDWTIQDIKRPGVNPAHKMYPNINNDEDDDNDIDFLSNGFKIRGGLGANTFVYMVWSNNPFVTSTGVPVTAR